MPTYDYKCIDCGYVFEKFHSMSAEPVKECPKCAQPVEKLIGVGAGIIFKGKGFYSTDYRKQEPEIKESASAPSTSCSGGSCACSP